MFGGIAALGFRLYYATYEGTVVMLEPETGKISFQFTVFPSGPPQVHVSTCAVEPDGNLLLGDTRHRRVRRFAPGGMQLALVGGLANPGIEDQDDAGILDEPCALLPLDDQLVVACGGFEREHGVQAFTIDGDYLTSFEPPPGGWKRAQGLALLDDAVLVAETEGGRIRRHAPDGAYLNDLDLHPDMRRPFRLAADSYGGLLLLLAPETEEEQAAFGVARLDLDGTFEGWVVKASEEPGHVYCPYDVAVLHDGRFVVADLPFGKPPEVRLQLFASDGRHLATLLEDSSDLAAAQERWFESILAIEERSTEVLYEKARVYHYYGGGARDNLELARELYAGSLEHDPSFLPARLGLAALLQQGLGEPAAAAEEYRKAIEAGGSEGDLLARMAECRHDAGEIDEAIRLLQQAVEGKQPPEDYHARVEELGNYYLERAGETPESMI